MKSKRHASYKRFRDQGVSILIIAVSMIFVLGMAGLGIDLASLYVARSQAQRAADAAALAGANALASPTNSCVNSSGGSLSPDCMLLAKQHAKAVGDLNLVAGVSPNIPLGDITFLSESASDPRIQVVVARDTAHGDPMPTFFVKIFGIDTANVSATAVAEAYSPNGLGPQIGSTCVKPWLIPNCDPNNTLNPNSTCTDGAGPFVIPVQGGMASTLAPGRNTLYDPSNPAGSGVIGEPFTLKHGSPGDAAAPGVYYAAYVPDTTTVPSMCPDCAKLASGGSSESAAVYRENIACCNQSPYVCGPSTVTLSAVNGNMVGPTRQGVDCLIQQTGNNSNCGQDYLQGITSPCANPANPQMPIMNLDEPHFTIIAGPNNTNPGEHLDASTSSSVALVPIWDGTPLQSGQNTNVNIVGFMQIFIQDEGSPQGSVYGNIMKVTPCDGTPSTGPTGPGGGGPIIGGGGSPIPVRLVHP